MTKQLDCKSATSLSLEELAAAFNAAFAGYFYPMQMNAELLARRVRLEQLDLQNSLLAYDGQEFVGLTLFGLRGQDGWCGGFGIVPEFRGRGCANQLMREFVARARGCGVKNLSLEVLTRNMPARRLYERFGLSVKRDLLILESSGREDLAQHRRELKETQEVQALLRHFERLHGWQPAWQRGFLTMLSADQVRGYYLGDLDAPEAYALLVERPDGVTQVIDLAADTEVHAAALAAGISRRGRAMRVVNEPEESLFAAALKAQGFIEVDRQHEMVCVL